MNALGSVTVQQAAPGARRRADTGTVPPLSRTPSMTTSDIKRLPPDQLVEEVQRKGDRAPVDDETVRREVAKDRETSPTGAPKEDPPQKSG